MAQHQHEAPVPGRCHDVNPAVGQRHVGYRTGGVDQPHRERGVGVAGLEQHLRGQRAAVRDGQPGALLAQQADGSVAVEAADAVRAGDPASVGVGVQPPARGQM
jgi:hypothetical protein